MTLEAQYQLICIRFKKKVNDIYGWDAVVNSREIVNHGFKFPKSQIMV